MSRQFQLVFFFCTATLANVLIAQEGKQAPELAPALPMG